MNQKINRIYQDIKRSETKIEELTEHVQEQRRIAERLENETIVKRLRALTNDPAELASLVKKMEQQSKQQHKNSSATNNPTTIPSPKEPDNQQSEMEINNGKN